MKRFLLAPLLVLLLAGAASALTFNATLTADNHYALYHGNELEGIGFVGRNEKGAIGNPSGTFNWSKAENYTFDVEDGDYIYVVGWSDDWVAQGWIGQFVSERETILTNASDWEYLLTNTNLDDWSDAPTVSELTATITGATWNSNPQSMDHGSNPWFAIEGAIEGISMDADWIWGTDLLPGSGVGEYQVFRTKIASAAPVPEPATMILIGTGLAGLAGFKRRKK